MKTMGIKCSKDGFAWVTVEGSCRADANQSERHTESAPDVGRGEQLVWVHRQVRELVEGKQPEAVAIRVADPPRTVNANWASGIARAEIEGVVKETLAELDVPCTSLSGPGVRSAFAARNNAALETALAELPVMDVAPQSFRDQRAAAVALLPADTT